MRTRCTRLLRNRGAKSKFTDLKKRPKMRPSFGRFFGSSTRCEFISTRGYAHTLHMHL